jgi:phage tail-like protein
MDIIENIIGSLNEPVPSFFFEVLILDEFDNEDPKAMDGAMASLALQVLDPVSAAFSEVSGLEITLGSEEYTEAGWSTPRPMFTAMSNSELTLKRYLRPRHVYTKAFLLDPISGWCQETIEAAKTWESKITTKSIIIIIYHPTIPNPFPGPGPLPIAGFLVQGAYPTKWAVSDLNSTEESTPITETIGFKYTELSRVELPLI